MPKGKPVHGRVYIARKLEYAVLDLLKAHCHLGEDGFAQYEEGWSDFEILAMFPEGVTIHHIKSIRGTAIGALRPYHPPTKTREMDAKIAALESKLERLEKAVAFLQRPAANLFETAK